MRYVFWLASWLVVVLLVAGSPSCGPAVAGRPGGGGGGGGGGDGALQRTDGGAGGAGGCTVISQIDQRSVLRAGYTPAAGGGPVDYVYFSSPRTNPDAGVYEMLVLQYWFVGSGVPPLPIVQDAGPMSWHTCSFCPRYYDSCNASYADCTRGYLAQGGSISVTALSQEPANGIFAASGSDLRLDEWDFNTDDAGAGHGCVMINAWSFNAHW